MNRVLGLSYEMALEHNDADRIKMLQVQISESCKNIMRKHSENPGLAASIRHELTGNNAHLGGESLVHALKMIDGLKGWLNLVLNKLLILFSLKAGLRNPLTCTVYQLCYSCEFFWILEHGKVVVTTFISKPRRQTPCVC